MEEVEFAASTNNVLELLIELVQNYEFLYNLKHKEYKNNRRKEQGWQEIANVLNISVDECKKHWRNLRDRFLREKREKPPGSGGPGSRWRYFEKMLFYAHYSKPRKTTTHIPTAKVPSRPLSSCSSLLIWSSESKDLDFEENKASVQLSIHQRNRQTSLDKNTPKSSQVIKQTGTKRKADIQIDEMVETAKTTVATLKENTPTQKENANTTFIHYVLARLEEMSSGEAKERRRKMLLALES